MKSWLQNSVAQLKGATTTIYGPSAVHSVTRSINNRNPSSRIKILSEADYNWRTPQSCHVETQTFYVTAKTGHLCFVQILHSNVGSWTPTAQVTCRVFHPSDPSKHGWVSVNLSEFSIRSDDRTSFNAPGVFVKLNKDQTIYNVSINLKDQKTFVELTFERTCPGLKFGEDGETFFGTDPKQPWMSIRHQFWPRARTSGLMHADGQNVDLDGLGMFSHALQQGKPHHLARAWDFANFQGKNFSAVMMQFTTTESYGSENVNVGIVARDDGIVAATIDNEVLHKDMKEDASTRWNEPGGLLLKWQGFRFGNEDPITATIDQELGKRVGRVDILQEIPFWIKGILSNMTGIRPYIYQHMNKAKLEIQTIHQKVEDEGLLFTEITFIS